MENPFSTESWQNKFLHIFQHLTLQRTWAWHELHQSHRDDLHFKIRKRTVRMATIPPEEPITLWIQLRSNAAKLRSMKADKAMLKINRKSRKGNKTLTLMVCSSSSNSLSALRSINRGEATARTTNPIAANLSYDENLLPLLQPPTSIHYVITHSPLLFSFSLSMGLEVGRNHPNVNFNIKVKGFSYTHLFFFFLFFIIQVLVLHFWEEKVKTIW